MNELYSEYDGVRYRYYLADDADAVIDELIDLHIEGLQESVSDEEDEKYINRVVDAIRKYKRNYIEVNNENIK